VNSLIASGVVDHESPYELLWTLFSDGSLTVKFRAKFPNEGLKMTIVS
jgi:hypothetical protein